MAKETTTKIVNPSITIKVKDNTPDAAFRLFSDEKKQTREFFVTSRTGGIKRVTGGYEVEIPSDLYAANKKYELKVLSKKNEVIDGKLEALKTANT